MVRVSRAGDVIDIEHLDCQDIIVSTAGDLPLIIPLTEPSSHSRTKTKLCILIWSFPTYFVNYGDVQLLNNEILNIKFN